MSRAHRDIMLVLSEGETPEYEQIYDQVRRTIASGSLSAGMKLPSIRSLQAELGISHTTIERAYLQLAAEGYVASVPRSGYVVEALDTDFLRLAEGEGSAETAQALGGRNRDAFFAEYERGAKARYDFSYANLPAGSFPVATWRKLTTDVLYANRMPALGRYAYMDEPSPLAD